MGIKYLNTKKGSLEEAISKAMSGKPEQLKEAKYEIQFSPGDFDEMSADDFADDIQNDLKNDYKIRAKVSNYGRKAMGLTFDTNVPKAKMLKVLEDEMGYMVEGYDVNAKELEEAGGKYLKYSDLLLQKGRLMAKNQSTAMIDKEIKKEMGKLGIKEKLDPVGKEDGDIDNDGDKDSSDKYLAKKRKAITKAIANEDLEKDDEKSVKKVIKGLKKAVDAHSGQVKSLTKDIQDETNRNVDETLDLARKANVEKGRSMRNILADIWNMNEGKSPFELEEAPKMKNYKNEPNFFTNDSKDTLDKFRNRDGYGETEFASYLAQKTGKDPEDLYFDDDELVYGSKTIMRGAHKQTVDKLLAKLKTIRSQNEPDMGEGKTVTGEKPTKVEIEPKVG